MSATWAGSQHLVFTPKKLSGISAISKTISADISMPQKIFPLLSFYKSLVFIYFSCIMIVLVIQVLKTVSHSRIAFTLMVLEVLTSTHNLCFSAEIRKIMHTPITPSFTISKVGFKVVKNI